MHLRLIITTLLLSGFCNTLSAQSIEINARASRDQVPMNEPFNIVYTLNVDGKFTSPDLSALKLLSGPAKGSQSSVTIINGKFSQSVTVTYTFLVRGKKEGQFTIPPATVTIDGKNYKSNSISVTITKATADIPDDEQAVVTGKNKFAFTQITLSKNKVSEGEPVLAVYKLFTVYNSNSPDELKFGAQPGCWIQEIKPGGNGWAPTTQVVSGRRYNVFVLKKEILIPQKSGKITLEAFDLGMVSQVNFFESRRFDMVSNAPVLEVTPLPSPKPEGFTGAVGSYSLTTKISTQELKVNEPLDLTVTLEGTGNIKLCEITKPEFPADFEVYDPEISEKISVTESGMSGKKELKFLFIPRSPGNFTVPKTAFSYYDLGQGKYITLYIPEYLIKVKKEDGTEVNAGEITQDKKTVKTLQTDIRYLKDLGATGNSGESFTGSTSYYVTVTALPMLFLLLLIIPRKSYEQAEQRKSVQKLSREISLLLQEAGSALAQGNKTLFYDKAGQALQLQLLKKTGIEAVKLSQLQLQSELLHKGIRENTAANTAALFDTLEMARYASLSAGDEAALKEKLENVIHELNTYRA